MGGDQVSAAANAIVQAGAQGLGLHEVLTGAMAAEFGPLPLISLPQEEALLVKFVRQMGIVLSNKGIYRRDSVVVMPDWEAHRLNILEAKTFCSWAQRHVVNYKLRYDKNGEPFTTYKDMPTEIAEKTLTSVDFLPHIPAIKKVLPIPMPVLAGDDFSLLKSGFDAGRYTFKF
jgi:hypothetical protein